MGCGYSSWSPRLANCSIITPLAALIKTFDDVTYHKGCDVESNDTSGFAAAVAAAKAADMVVFVGGNRNCEGGQGVGGHTCSDPKECPTHCESGEWFHQLHLNRTAPVAVSGARFALEPACMNP